MKGASNMESYTRVTVHGPVTGRHAALVDAAGNALDAMVPAGVSNLLTARRSRVSRVRDLAAALTLDYDVLPAEAV
jgi:hypothetical protein